MDDKPGAMESRGESNVPKKKSTHENEKCNEDNSDEKQDQNYEETIPNVIDVAVGKNCSTPKFNEKLKATLEKHGISKQNADSFLLGLLGDKDFKKLVKANLVEDDSSDDDNHDNMTAVPMTRSKLKEVMKNSPFKPPWVPPTLANNAPDNDLPKFSELPLPENEEEEDEEYRPEESICSDTQDQSFTEPLSKKLEDGAVSVGTVEAVPIDASVTESDSANNAAEKDLISTRTRSKHSLQSTSLDVLEAAFDPPDASADMYDMNIGDYDWQKWLADLVKDTSANNAHVTEDEDDPDVDPDFEFPHEVEEPDQEDLRDDFSVRVSKKELDSLLDEVENMDKDDWPPVTFPTSPRLNDSVQSSRDEHNHNKPINNNTIQQNTESHLPLFHVTKEQEELLQQQLCQHVQLLVQGSILCRNKSELSEYVEESNGLLQELVDIGKSQMNKLNITSSAVMPWVLQDAVELVKINVPISEPSVRLLRMERVKGLVSIPMAVAQILGNSTVFMYKELLPFSAPSDKCLTQKLHFRKSEDCLLALGLAEMANLPNMYELISEHMLPTKTEKQLRSRVKNVVYCRNQKDNFNPIRKYHSCGILPHSRKDVKFVHQDTAKKPIDMKGVLPNWLIVLKPMFPPEDSSSEYSQSESSDVGPGYQHSTPHAKPKNPNLDTNKTPMPSQQDVQQTLNTQCQVTASPIRAIMVPYVPVIPQIVKVNDTPKIGASPRKILPKPAGGATASTVNSINDIASPTNISTCLQVGIETSIKSTVVGEAATKIDLTEETPSSNSAPPMMVDDANNIEPCGISQQSPDTSNKKASNTMSDSVLTKDNNATDKISCSETSPKAGLTIARPKISQGKSLKAMTECEPQPVSSSEDENEDDKPAKNKGDNSETEEVANATAESADDDDISDHEEAVESQAEEEQSKPAKSKLTKSANGYGSLPVGGYLRKVHPKFSGKKAKSSSRDLRRLRSTAKSIRTLEEDSIVQLDPNRMEKERIFAAGFNERVQEVLKDHPEIYKNFLETLIKYSDGTRSPIDLYIEISNLLQDWPEVVQSFAPFLMPEQAQECGMAAEQHVYARARKFLRQLEIQFSEDPDTMEKISNVFHTVAGTAIYREEEMMHSILNLLKGYPYLQDEFLTFFDDCHPPKFYYDEDFEEVDLTEELLKDPTLNQFEQVTLPTESHVPDNAPVVENNTKKPKKRRLSLTRVETDDKSPSKVVALSENKENIYPDITSADADDEEDPFNTDYESEEAMAEDLQEEESLKITNKKVPNSIPPDITVISEDALSSSPFKRITEECQKADAPLRPDTPTGMRLDNTRSITLSRSPITPSKSLQTDALSIPKTPTGKNLNHVQDGLVDNGETNNILIPYQQSHENEKQCQIRSDNSDQPCNSNRTDIPNKVDNSLPDNRVEDKIQSDKDNTNGEDRKTAESPASVAWTREMDVVIITSYQEQGTINQKLLSGIAAKINRTPSEIESRLNRLLSLFESAETDDTSQESEEDTDMLESDESSNI